LDAGHVSLVQPEAADRASSPDIVCLLQRKAPAPAIQQIERMERSKEWKRIEATQWENNSKP
jgi:hypothetical protein